MHQGTGILPLSKTWSRQRGGAAVEGKDKPWIYPRDRHVIRPRLPSLTLRGLQRCAGASGCAGGELERLGEESEMFLGEMELEWEEWGAPRPISWSRGGRARYPRPAPGWCASAAPRCAARLSRCCQPCSPPQRARRLSQPAEQRDLRPCSWQGCPRSKDYVPGGVPEPVPSAPILS